MEESYWKRLWTCRLTDYWWYIYIYIYIRMVLKLGRSGQQIRNAWKVLNCGAGEGWRRTVGPIMWEIKGQIEVTRRRGRRRKKLLDDLKDRRGYCQLKEEALDRTVWRNRFGRGFGPVVWQITSDEDECQVVLVLGISSIRYVRRVQMLRRD